MCCDGEVNGIHPPALLRAIYESRELYVREVLPGIFPFVDWLPVGDKYFRLPGRELGQPLSYKSCGLARRLGLRNLHIAFSGYWPERGANLVTRSFKEFEVQASICRFLASCPEGEIPPLIVASAGNTGNAYNFMTSLLGLPLYLVVPESALEHLRLPIQASARVVAVQGDYTDSIRVAEQLKPMLRAQTDGGIRNVGRRAGMGVVYLNAVLHPSQGMLPHAARSSATSPEGVRNIIPLTVPFFKITNSIASFPCFRIGGYTDGGMMVYQFAFTTCTTRVKYGPKSTPNVSVKISAGAIALNPPRFSPAP